MKTTLPTIKIGKITLREIMPTDYLDYFEIGCNPEVVEHLNWGPFNNPNEALWIITEVFYKRPLDGIPIGYAIVINNKMVGVIDYHTYYPNVNTCEIGYILHRDYWGMGIMRKCLKAIVDIGFNYLQLDKLICGHTIYNQRSKRTIEACGFKYEYQKMVRMKERDELGYFYSIHRYEYKGGL